MLRDIKSSQQSITFAQYLFEGGALAEQFAEAFAERCRAGVQADILLDDHGSGNTPDEIIALMRDAGCRVEFFRRVEVPAIIFPWKLLDYNYRSHRRILVIDGRVGFTGGYGIADSWIGDGRTAQHWRDTNARIEGPAVKFLQAAFAESWLQTTAHCHRWRRVFSAAPELWKCGRANRSQLAGRREFSNLSALPDHD